MSVNLDPATEGKNIVNVVYHAAVLSGLTLGYAKLGKMVLGGQMPRLDFTAKDVSMITAELASAIATRDLLVKQGILPANIMN